MRLMAATGILGPADASGSRRQRSTSNRHENDVKKMQQTLRLKHTTAGRSIAAKNDNHPQ
jgi:hypothetical protein